MDKRTLFVLCNIYILQCNTQNTVVNDQLQTVVEINDNHVGNDTNVTTTQNINEVSTNDTEVNNTEVNNEPNPIKKRKRNDVVKYILEIISVPMMKFVGMPKVSNVLRNIGTCIVNGVMEIVTYYLPAPVIPLLATAASIIIPFEPIYMLRRKMPVTSYRRAFQTAVNGFVNTFNGLKIDNYDDDPYMTRRFNRRFMNDNSKEKIHE